MNDTTPETTEVAVPTREDFLEAATGCDGDLYVLINKCEALLALLKNNAVSTALLHEALRLGFEMLNCLHLEATGYIVESLIRPEDEGAAAYSPYVLVGIEAGKQIPKLKNEIDAVIKTILEEKPVSK